MPIKRSIPGQLHEYEMLAIELIASFVPESGVIVEVGSLWGLSSWIWAKSAHPTVMVHCFDPWPFPGEGGKELEAMFHTPLSKEQFEKHVADCHNVVAHQGFSPRDFLDWDKLVDLYFEDSVHKDPIFSENIGFWTKHVKEDGVICGHDYLDKFPDVVRGVTQLAARLNREVLTVQSFWCLLPEGNKSESFKAKLNELAKRAQLESAR